VKSKSYKGLSYAVVGIALLDFLMNYSLQIILLVSSSMLGFWYYREWHKKILRISGINEIDRMRGTEFEERMKLLFEDIGYCIEKTPITGDFGADLIAQRPGERIAIQCKRYSYPVGVKAVQEVATSVKHYNADRAIVITNNRFTQQAHKLAKTNEVELWDRTRLIEMLCSVTNKEYNLPLLLQRLKQRILRNRVL
jgi:HJR/Mrr/RecB family endonuclease